VEAAELPECQHPPYLNKMHEARQLPYQENTFSVCYQCLCKTKDEGIVAAIEEYDAAAAEADKDAFCKTNKSFGFKNMIITLIASVAVVAINVALKMILKMIVHFEKPHNLGELNSSIAIKVFIAQVSKTPCWPRSWPNFSLL
jgi:hypothetical protein